MVVVGFDGRPDAIAAIRAGDLRATVLQPAVRGAEMAVEQAIECHLVTPGNVDDFGLFALKAQARSTPASTPAAR